VIYSVWQPDGGYQYFSSSDRFGIGNDLPEPDLPPEINGIGVPAQDAGRAVPSGGVPAGTGRKPKGVIAPTARISGVSGVSGISIGGSSLLELVGLFAIGYVLFKSWKGRK
jgi:hypothetical protein